MNIEILNKYTIKITLSQKDMNNYSINYEKINYNNKKTRQLIISLLHKIHKTTNIDILKSKIFIEAFPTKENGCILYLNITNDQKKHNKQPLIITLKCIEDFKTMCKTLIKKHYIKQISNSTLLKATNCLILIIYSNNKLPFKISHIFFEYGNIVGYGELSKKIIEEHCQLIIKNNAIETILKSQTKAY